MGSRKVAKIDEGDLLQAEMQWTNTLVGYALGEQLYYHHLKAFVLRSWNPKGSLDVLTRDNGFFMFKFSMKEDMTGVLEGGPYMFEGRPLVLKVWNRHVGLERDILLDPCLD